MGVRTSLTRPEQRHVVAWTWALLVANTVIILTGGLVRLTSSGLGCPTWPRCTEQSYTPHAELGLHGAIEFGNRLLTYVLIAVAIAAVVAVRRWAGATAGQRRLVVLLALGIPFQGVIGGITVLTQLNPWVVALHLLLSMALVAGSTVLLLGVRGTTGDTAHRGLAVVTYAVIWVTVYLGTVVTGSGPHAGDEKAVRTGLDPHVMSHVHAASVYVLLAVTLLLVWRSRGTALGVAATWLFAAELGQGVIGFVQYFTDLPIALVAVPRVGAAILVALGTRVLLLGTGRRVDQPLAAATPGR